jgi:hypothetical protein
MPYFSMPAMDGFCFVSMVSAPQLNNTPPESKSDRTDLIRRPKIHDSNYMVKSMAENTDLYIKIMAKCRQIT